MDFQEASANLVSSHGLCTRMGKNPRGGEEWGDTVSYLLLWRCAPSRFGGHLEVPAEARAENTPWGRLIPRHGPSRCTDARSPRTAYGPVQSRASGVPLQLVATYFLISRVGADVIYPMMDPSQH